MSRSYLTVRGETESVTEIKRSKFIATIAHVEGGEEAENFVRGVRKRYSDATHNCYAYIADERGSEARFSDDGEPGGTAGQPMLEVLKKRGLVKTAVVVTRYFGGIKLGTGGLVRAYTGSARLGIEAAGICDVTEMSVIRFRVEYPVFSRIQSVSLPGGAAVSGEEYTDRVAFDVTCPPEDAEAVKKAVSEYSAGGAGILSETADFVRVKRG